MEIVIGGTEATVRADIFSVIQNKLELTKSQNRAVIRSLNHQLHLFLGKAKPDMDLCRCLAVILGVKIPETFEDQNSFHGLLPKQRIKWKGLRNKTGGKDSLSERINHNYRDTYIKKKKKADPSEIFEADQSQSSTHISLPIPTAPNKNISDWLNHLEDHFPSIVLSNLSASHRQDIILAMDRNMELTTNQAKNVINSINFHTFQFIGAVKPDPSLGKCLAEMVAKMFPGTFTDSDIGVLTQKIREMFHNRYIDTPRRMRKKNLLGV